MAREFTASSSEYLEVSSSPVTAWPITFGCWWRPANTTTQSEFFSLQNSGGQAVGLALGSRSDGSDFRARYRRQNNYVWGDVITANTWHHVVARITVDDDHDIFTNGNKTDGSIDEPVPSITNVAFGALRDSSPSNYSDGAVAEAFIYDVALTDAEIAALAAGYSPLFIRPASLQAYWPLIRDEDQDRRGGYDLTAYNTPTILEHPPVIYPSMPYIGFGAAGSPPASSIIPLVMHHFRQQGIT